MPSVLKAEIITLQSDVLDVVLAAKAQPLLAGIQNVGVGKSHLKCFNFICGLIKAAVTCNSGTVQPTRMEMHVCQHTYFLLALGKTVSTWYLSIKERPRLDNLLCKLPGSS